MDSETPIIQAQGLRKAYGSTQALDGVDFSVRAGEIFAYLGPNGAGKTTTINIFCGLLAPDQGRADICGLDIQKDPVAVKARIGVVPDESNLYPELTCRRNLDYLGQLYRLGRSERRTRIDELLARFHLADRADKPFKSLSKGLKRRLTVAASLIHGPEVVFLDEPTTGLDVPSARDLRKLVKEINQAGATVFLTTHNLAEAEELADRVAILLQGRLVTLGRTEDIRRQVSQTRFISVTFSQPILAETIRVACPAVRSVADESGRFRLEAVEIGPAVAQLAAIARREEVDIADLTTAPPSLEETFVSIINQEAGS